MHECRQPMEVGHIGEVETELSCLHFNSSTSFHSRDGHAYQHRFHQGIKGAG